MSVLAALVYHISIRTQVDTIPQALSIPLVEVGYNAMEHAAVCSHLDCDAIKKRCPCVERTCM